MKFHRVTYAIKNPKADWEKQVTGWQFNDSGLAARVSDKKGMWFIDHIPTGHRIKGYWPSRGAAHNAIEALAGVVNWHGALESIVNRGVYDKIRPIVHKFGGPLT